VTLRLMDGAARVAVDQFALDVARVLAEAAALGLTDPGGETRH
jgi:hypothetical protein